MNPNITYSYINFFGIPWDTGDARLTFIFSTVLVVLVGSFCMSVNNRGIFSSHRLWKSERDERIDYGKRLNAGNKSYKDSYKRTCQREAQYAKNFLKSIAWSVSLFIWPLTLPLLALYAIFMLVKLFWVTILGSNSVINSARGKFNDFEVSGN